MSTSTVPGPASRLLAALAAVALVAAVSAATARAWTTPATLSPAGEVGVAPQIGVASDGDALVAWQATGTGTAGVKVRSRSAAGALGPVRRISSTAINSYEPQVAINAAGQGIVAWWSQVAYGDDRVQARTRAADGTLGPIKTLSAVTPVDPSGIGIGDVAVAIDADGRGLVAWTRHSCTDTYAYCDRVQARTLAADGAMGTVKNVSSAGQHAVGLDLAMEAGDAIASWAIGTGAAGDPNRVQVRTLSAAGALGTTSALSRLGDNANNAQVALDPAGAATVVWDVSNLSVEARVRNADGTLGPIRTLSQDDPLAHTTAALPQVGVDATGRALVVWKQSRLIDDDGDPGTPRRQLPRIQARRITGGVPSALEQVSPFDVENEVPRVAVAPNGQATIVWRGLRDTTATGLERAVLGRVRSAAGAYAPRTYLSRPGTPGSHGEAFEPQVAADGGGGFYSVWQRFNDEDTFNCCERVQLSAGP